jgi:hypothetical protein
MRRHLDPSWPVWLRDLDSLLGVHPYFVVSGNVRDWYPVPAPVPTPTSVAHAVHAGLATVGFDVVLVHNVVSGFSVLADDQTLGWNTVQTVVGRDLRSTGGADFSALSHVLLTLAQCGTTAGRPVPAGVEPRRLALVIEPASRLANRADHLEQAELELFRTAAHASLHAERVVCADADGRVMFNPVVWVVDREHDLPAWFTAANPGLRSISIPVPDLAERERVAERWVSRLRAGPAGASLPSDASARLAAATDGLGARALLDLRSLLHDHGFGEVELDDAIRMFKVGAAESPWRAGEVGARLRGDKPVPGETRGTPARDFLASRVLGQDAAVTKSVDILTRAVIGLSGAHAARSSGRPRGVLFFVGPTGTGKTELAKSITELVFGSPDAYVRFDMSEFAAEHAGDRLIGAPPGYVGFDAGGELTNAVRRRPYSLLLFDEIEKAHPLILDKFLQILEDGRLTDGRGTTVHFSETLIVYTSNIGFYQPSDDGRTLEPNIETSEPYGVIEDKIRKAVREFFSSQLNRPELLNRIGDNVVVFDFVRPEIGRSIADKQVANVVRRVRAAAGIDIEIGDTAAETIRQLTTADLTFGGRGIGNVIESRLVNPLARALFATASTTPPVPAGSPGPPGPRRAVVEDVAPPPDPPEVRLTWP